MLEAKEPTIGEIHIAGRERLVNRHQELMEKILIQNAHKDLYWVLGMAKCKRKQGRTIIRPFLEAYDVQPEIRKESFLYEVNNLEGGQPKLLWVMHPNNKLSLPQIGKTISVADTTGVNLAAEVTGAQ
jgi:hypothetical protein